MEYQTIEFSFTAQGDLIFPWWNPMAQEIIDAIDGKIVDEEQGSIFCG